MLKTQEATFVILMAVTQEPTKKWKIAATYAFQNHWMIYCYIPSSCKASATSQKVLKESMHSCMRTCKQSSWGVCWATKIPHFIHQFTYYLSPYSIISFHKTINIHHFHNKYHNRIWTQNLTSESDVIWHFVQMCRTAITEKNADQKKFIALSNIRHIRLHISNP